MVTVVDGGDADHSTRVEANRGDRHLLAATLNAVLVGLRTSGVEVTVTDDVAHDVRSASLYAIASGPTRAHAIAATLRQRFQARPGAARRQPAVRGRRGFATPPATARPLDSRQCGCRREAGASGPTARNGNTSPRRVGTGAPSAHTTSQPRRLEPNMPPSVSSAPGLPAAKARPGRRGARRPRRRPAPAGQDRPRHAPAARHLRPHGLRAPHTGRPHAAHARTARDRRRRLRPGHGPRRPHQGGRVIRRDRCRQRESPPAYPTAGTDHPGYRPNRAHLRRAVRPR